MIVAADFPDASPGGIPGDSLSDGLRGAVPGPPRRRSPGIVLLALVDLALAGLCLYALRLVASAQSYAISTSPEIGSELEAALAGFAVLRVALYVAAGGFVVSAVAALSLSRLGFAIQVVWAVLTSLTLIGLPYGLPALVYLFRRDTRARFGRARRDPDARGRLLALD